MTTALVTGATGFVGAAIVRQLLQRGTQVRVLARKGSDRRNLADLSVEIFEGDLADPASLKGVAEGCSVLFHAAADYRLWSPDPQLLYQINVDGTEALFREAMRTGVERIVYTSSVATLGLHRDGRPSDEEVPSTLADMVGHYKRSKFLAEARVGELIAEIGLPCVIASPAAPIGPGDVKPTPTGETIVDAANGRIPAFVDTGLCVVHVDDVAQGHLLALEHGEVGRRYILGGTNMTLQEMLAEVARIEGRRAPTVKIPYQAVLPIAWIMEGVAKITGKPPRVPLEGVRMSAKKMFFDSGRAERELGYQARDGREAIADALNWFHEQGYVQ